MDAALDQARTALSAASSGSSTNSLTSCVCQAGSELIGGCVQWEGLHPGGIPLLPFFYPPPPPRNFSLLSFGEEAEEDEEETVVVSKVGTEFSFSMTRHMAYVGLLFSLVECG